MGLFLGRETRAAGNLFPEPPVPPFLGATIDGLSKNASDPLTAMQVPTVWACISLLAGAVSSLPLETFRRTSDIAAVPHRLPNPSLIVTPDETMTTSEWLHMLMVSLLTRGNAYGYIGRRDSQGYPASVHLLPPDSVKVETDKETGRVTYRTGIDNHIIPTENMWHVRGLTLPGTLVGLSPISYAAATLGLDLSSRSFASGFFDGGGIPKAILESDQPIDQPKAQAIKDRVMATLRGREPLVLGLGLKYTAIQVAPEESQFLATQQANVAQICRFFSVPAAMVDGPAGGGMQYSNTEQRGIEFLTYSLAHWLKRIEDAMFSLLPGQQYVRFNVQHLLRTDAETQAKVFVQYLAGKVLTPTEVRAELGRDPMTEAQRDEADLVPINITATGAPYMNRPLQKQEVIASDGAPTGSQTAPAGVKPPTPPPAATV